MWEVVKTIIRTIVSVGVAIAILVLSEMYVLSEKYFDVPDIVLIIVPSAAMFLLVMMVNWIMNAFRGLKVSGWVYYIQLILSFLIVGVWCFVSTERKDFWNNFMLIESIGIITCGASSVLIALIGTLYQTISKVKINKNFGAFRI